MSDPLQTSAPADPVNEALDLMNNDDDDAVEDVDVDGFGDFAIGSDDEEDDDMPANPFKSTEESTGAANQEELSKSVTSDVSSSLKTVESSGGGGLGALIGSVGKTASSEQLQDNSDFEHPLAEGAIAQPPATAPPAPAAPSPAPAPTSAPSSSSSGQLYKNISSTLSSFATKAAQTAQAVATETVQLASTANVTPSMQQQSQQPPQSTPPPPPTTQQQQQQTPQHAEMDNALKSKIITSAFGPLLPGERVIMFLSHLPHVVDSSSPHSFLGTGKGFGKDIADDVVWCCAMTFYRLVLFSYRESQLPLLQQQDTGNGDGTNIVVDDSAISTLKDKIEQYTTSASISRQFQSLHMNYAEKPNASTKLHHYLIQMPLASIDRVERSTIQMYGSSSSGGSSSSSNPYLNYTNKLIQNQPYPSLPQSSSNAASSSAGASGQSTTSLVIHGKDNYRRIQFTTFAYTDIMRAQEALSTYAFPGRRNLGYLFAFESRRAEVMASTQTPTTTTGNGGGENNKPPTPPTQRLITALPTKKRFDASVEFHRQGIFSPKGDNIPSPWSHIQVNSTYNLCNSYPSILIGPTKLSDTTAEGSRIIRQCASFRSERRLPSLTWGSKIDGASLWRCAQPKVGLQGNRNSADETYLRVIAESANEVTKQVLLSSSSSQTISKKRRPSLPFLKMLTGNTTSNDTDLLLRDCATVMNGTAAATPNSNSGVNNYGQEVKPRCLMKILDLRPKSAAMANRTQGYGYENTSYYQNFTINFMGIGNIHAVRDAYQKISNLCLDPTAKDVQWTQLVEETRWPSMIRLILSASWQTAFHIHFNRLPVLLHCSHGWDRTSQVAALAQIFLDPYYRTKEGFACLVEKDFMSFGHPFHTRGGHGEGRGERGGGGPGGNNNSQGGSGGGGGGGGGGDEGQLAPIFIQFLDCAFQIVNQYPDYFEFNTKYLLLLSEHVYSCRFGTLLCDSEREREVVAGIRQRTYCLWDYLDSIDELVNVNFNPKTCMMKKEGDQVYGEDGVLMMPLPTLLRNVTLWADRHCMYGPKATVRCMPGELDKYCRNGGGTDSSNEAKDRSPLLSMNDKNESELRRAMEEAAMWKHLAESYRKELEALKGGIKAIGDDVENSDGDEEEKGETNQQVDRSGRAEESKDLD